MELTWEYRKPTWLLFGLLGVAISSILRNHHPKREGWKEIAC
jgi:hypothetical protein